MDNLFPQDDDLITDDEVDAILGEDDVEYDEDALAVAQTYRLDFATGKISGGFIDEEEALRQFIIKALMTPRDEYAIYTEDYGSELEELIAEQEGPDYILAEAPRIIADALENDDRVVSVDDVVVTLEGDLLTANITVSSIYGEITEEVTLIV